MMGPLRILGMTAVLSAALIGADFAAHAAVSAPAAATAPAGSLYGCVTAGRALTGVYTSAPNFPGCKTGFAVTVTSGTPAPPVTHATANLVSSPVTVTTGGSFTAGKTLAGTMALAPGTYLIGASFKATPDDAAAVTVFPQFMIYAGPQAADFSNDLFNIGAGGLEAAATNHDSYFSGSQVVTVPAGGETLDVYAFGYDSDSGSGSYVLDSARVDAVRIGA
jgi:hypothetical protein